MIRKSLLLGITALMALGVFALEGDSARAEVGAGSMTAMSLDMDPTGNTATSVGIIEDCVQAAAGATVTINLLAQGIPASYQMLSFGALLGMSDAVLNVTALDETVMIASAAGSAAGAASDPIPGPGPDDQFSIGAFDTGTHPGASESGDGTLAILDIEVNAAAVPGLYAIEVLDGGQVDFGAIFWTASVFNSGSIAVGGASCPSFVQGDVDCSGSVTSVDSLKILRHNAGLSVAQTEPCDDISTGTPIMGDVDCNLSVSSVDSLKILRHNAGLSVSQTEPCDDIGT